MRAKAALRKFECVNNLNLVGALFYFTYVVSDFDGAGLLILLDVVVVMVVDFILAVVDVVALLVAAGVVVAAAGFT